MNTEKHHYLKNFVNHPWVQGVVVLRSYCSRYSLEIFQLEHSITVMGILYLAQLTPNILQGIERIVKWQQK